MRQRAYISAAGSDSSLRRKLFRQSFEQRFGQRILYFSESPKVPLRHRDTPVEDRRPGYQRRGTARDERDGDDTSPAWRRSSDQEKCRQPEKRVPCGIAEGGLQILRTDQRCDERDPHAQEQAPVARFFSEPGRKHAAASTITALAASARTTCQVAHNWADTPFSGGVMPRPSSVRKDGAAPSRTTPTTRCQGCRGALRRQSQIPASRSNRLERPSAPAEVVNGPKEARKNVAGRRSPRNRERIPRGNGARATAMPEEMPAA